VPSEVAEEVVLARRRPVGGGDTEALGTHGRGLWLLRRLVDEVRLERVRRGTRVTQRAARPATA